MKKSKIICIVIFLLLIVTGCGGVGIETGEKLNRVLINKKIINNSYKYEDVVKHHHQSFSGGPGMVDNYFIYKNSSNGLIAIKYDYYAKDKFYVANMYYDVNKKDIETFDCDSETVNHTDSYYDNGDNNCSTDSKYSINYDDSVMKKYKVYQKSFILFKYYKVEEFSE